ncbi:MAG: peptide-methionine (S)-S-oxide reductase MsrA [Candidatus Eremiobacteraeota bacterium]|nr:peptide-methionine (S)-S-oxide reductase MsrA [Candidatus Eremiobacteraeota bacterium]
MLYKRLWIISASVGLSLFMLTSAGQARAASRQAQHVVLAGGCFWGMEAVFERLKGVKTVVSGFAGGARDTAHYEMVSTGTTGHAESVAITYDPSQISFRRLLEVYFTVAHDPTQLNRQGPDEGPQYRSEIFYTTEEQRRESEAYVKHLTDSHAFANPVVTKIELLRGFYPAEAYHQHFFDKNPENPYIVENDLPKVQRLRERFPDLLKARA